uniref:(northern house mosquito) hypothetical protein n=1 Tax=Culex pipiens TaxID=7175 RepID=A0A8D8BHX7_CULPI
MLAGLQSARDALHPDVADTLTRLAQERNARIQMTELQKELKKDTLARCRSGTVRNAGTSSSLGQLLPVGSDLRPGERKRLHRVRAESRLEPVPPVSARLPGNASL